jgi:predicted outer membrane repeat protein
MQPATTQTRRILLTLCVIVASMSQRGTSVARDEASVAVNAYRGGIVTVKAAGRGRPFLNLRDGREMIAMYRGDQAGVAALQNRTAKSRSLAWADFDLNGTPDVVAGYEGGGGGLITLQRGNPDAFAPTNDAVFARLQQGYDPAPLLPWADVYQVPVSPDFLVTGNFNSDSDKDVLVAARGGGLYLLAGDGRGGLGEPQLIDLAGGVTALAAGEFRAADVFTDVAVGVSGEAGNALVIFDDAAAGFRKPVVLEPLAAPATAIEFGGLDDDPFQDVAVAAGSDLLVVHGWGRKTPATAASRVDRVTVGAAVRGLAVGQFVWDRAGHSEIAALSEDGAIHILQQAKAETRRFSAAEAAERTRGKVRPSAATAAVDVESLPGWTRERAGRWRLAGWLPPGDCKDDGEGGCEADQAGRSTAPATTLLRSHLSYRETHDLMVFGGGRSTVEILHTNGPADDALNDLWPGRQRAAAILESSSAPVAVLALPRKINGVTDVLVLGSTNHAVSVLAAAPDTTITVDRTDDPSGAALTAASACTAAANDCSLRGAFQFANNAANNNTTISLPANTYVLSINGTSAGGCDGNTVGDLGANQTMSIVGAGAATTIIRQTGTGPANDGDRVMCMNEPFTIGLTYNFSGVTFVGGRDGTAAGTGTALGGGGIIGGELNNALTLTNVVFANNQVTVQGSANIGGGGLQITGGNLTITNSTFGGTSLPGSYTDRTSTTTGNLQGGSGGGVMYTPSSPQHAGGAGTLTISGSTFTRNTSDGIGGGGADLLIFAFASPGGIGSGSATIGTSTFSNNQADSTGGAIVVESLPTTVATTSFTNNSAGNRGGGIYVGGGGLLLNGNTPSIAFSGNTAVNGGSSISTAFTTTVQGTNVAIGGDIEISSGGSWTNSAGSVLAPTNVVIEGGTLNMNDSTMHVGGNLSIAHSSGTLVGGTFNGGSGTVNLAGNFTLAAGGTPATTLNAGTGTFNFNGTGAQSITNGTGITFNNLTDSNVTQPLTLNNSLAVNGTLTVNGLGAILSPAAAVVISGTGTLTGTGTARVSRIAATPDFLSQYSITNKTLTALSVDYNGAGAQTVNNAPAYSHLVISGSGTKTLQGHTTIGGNLNITTSTLAGSAFNFTLGGNWTNSGGFAPGTGTVTFAGITGTQTLTGNTTFFNLTLNNAGATTNFGTTTTTVGNDLTATAGTMEGGTSTVIFTGVTDNTGSIAGVGGKHFYNLQINSPATISHSAGGSITIENDYANAGTFAQAPALGTVFALDNLGDGIHAFAGGGTTTFGTVTIGSGNTVNAGAHSFNVTGSAFTATGAFSSTGTVTFNGAAAQTITGDGAKTFGGLLINNASGVQLANGAGAVDASVGGVLTLTTDFTVTAGAVLQQSGTSAGGADVLGIVRRTDLAGGATRSFGNLNNAVTINSRTAPAQLDLALVKAAPGTFPSAVRIVPRTVTLTPTGGAGMFATVRLRYVDPAELTGPGITESRLVLWKNIGGTWTPQGGTPDTAGNFVSQAGIDSFSEWAIAEGSDLTLTKANDVSGAAVTGQAWNWTLTASNSGAPATFAAGHGCPAAGCARRSPDRRCSSTGRPRRMVWAWTAIGSRRVISSTRPPSASPTRSRRS